MIGAFQIRPRPMVPSVKPARDRAYLRWVKRFPCICCGSTRQVDPAHMGPHGLGQKASDYTCLPLCRKCHDELGRGVSRFALVHSLDLPVLIEFQQRLWFLKTGIRIWEQAA